MYFSIMYDMHEHLVSVWATHFIMLQIKPPQSLHLHTSSPDFILHICPEAI